MPGLLKKFSFHSKTEKTVQEKPVSHGSAAHALSIATIVGAMGVVYGDIGTSPLYTLQTIFSYFPAHLGRWEIMGICSLIFWAITIVVTGKYISIVLRADNNGEGGILALMTLAQRVCSERKKQALALLGLAGACLLFGDGMITPAISILSAVEGLNVIMPSLSKLVIPISIVIVFCLFAIQSRGTAKVGRLFGPVMIIWFLTIGIFGINEIVRHPFILLALSPVYGIWLFFHYKFMAFTALGGVVLALTGAEALYADLGHFSAGSIRFSWFALVMPAIVLNYFGQGALVLSDPAAAANPFFMMLPGWFGLPMVILATFATIIASQALISGAYSLARQCVQFGFSPRLTVRHTSEDSEGQIYLPQVNTFLLIGVLILIVAFKTSNALAAAYGVAVTGTFICTVILAALVLRRQFGWSKPRVLVIFGGLMIIDLFFFSSNMLKLFSGGWVPIMIAVVLTTLALTWQRGRALLAARRHQDSLPLGTFLPRLPQSRITRVPGCAIFLTANADYVPPALLHNLKHNKVLHENVFMVTVSTANVPTVRESRRISLESKGEGIYLVSIRYGFIESPNLPETLNTLKNMKAPYDSMQASYFLGRETLVAAKISRMSFWRRWLFLVMSRNSVSATEFFHIPSDRVVELGVRVAI